MLDCNSLKTNWPFFERCCPLSRLNVWEVRSSLPYRRWFCNCLVMACVLFLHSPVAAYSVWSLTGSIRPLFVFAILAQPALRAPQIISGFSDIRIVLKWGFIQAGAGVIFNTWAQTKSENCLNMLIVLVWWETALWLNEESATALCFVVLFMVFLFLSINSRG